MRTAFLLAILLLFALPVGAQGKKNKPPIFDVDEEKSPEEQATPERIDSDPLQRTVLRLAGWPSDRSRLTWSDVSP